MKKKLLIFALILSIFSYNSITTLSEPSDVIATNEIANWPTGPEINAKAAILMEANSGVILYAKNIHDHMAPASTTKMMTALLAAENSSMDEEVYFSHDAVFSLEPGSSNIGIDPGQSMNMEECLYGIMVASANEVANAIGEHIGGDIPSFVEMMNDKAEDLGLEDTHFENANGLYEENHYTSAYDLAIIAREFFNNEYLAKIGNTASYHFVATSNQPDDFYVRNKHKLISGEIPYTGIKGGKTGYTELAGETLVTCAEQNGLMLICVILNEEAPDQFYDTTKLFDYGFSNFLKVNVAENEVKYSIKNNNSFPATVDVLGNSKQILELNDTNFVIMPKNITFDEMETTLDYNTESEDDIAYIRYSYHGVELGYGCIRAVTNRPQASAFDVDGVIDTTENEVIEENDKPLFINITVFINWIFAVTLALIIIDFIRAIFVNYNILDNLRRRKTGRPKRRKEKDKLIF